MVVVVYDAEDGDANRRRQSNSVLLPCLWELIETVMFGDSLEEDNRIEGGIRVRRLGKLIIVVFQSYQVPCHFSDCFVSVVFLAQHETERGIKVTHSGIGNHSFVRLLDRLFVLPCSSDGGVMCDDVCGPINDCAKQQKREKG